MDNIDKIPKIIDIEIESAPEGWKTAKEIASEMGGVTKKAIVTFAYNIAKAKNKTDFWIKKIRTGKSLVQNFHPDLIKEIFDSAIKPTPEGWISFDDAADKIAVDNYFFEKKANSFRSQYPEFFGIYLNTHNNRKCEHIHKNLLLKMKKIVEWRPEKAPSGWMTIGSIASVYAVGHLFVKNKADEYLIQHPNWSKKYLDSTGKECLHLHPDLVSLIRHEIGVLALAVPEGWSTIGALASKLNVSHGFIKRKVLKLSKQYPEWYLLIKKEKTSLEYIHPDLIALIRNEVDSRGEQVPNGWQTINALAVSLGVTHKFIKARVEFYKGIYPDWIRQFINNKNVQQEYLSPQLLLKINDDVNLRPEPVPQGWVTLEGMSNFIGVSKDILKKWVKQLLFSHPEWKKDYRSDANIVRSYLHPDLVDAINERKNLRAIPAPDGWSTIWGLADSLGVSSELVITSAERYRSHHPDWFGIYLDSINKTVEQLHPSLVALITKKILERESAPDNWLTPTSIKKMYHIGKRFIDRIAYQEQQSHPEWFKKYLDRAYKPAMHFHPDLVLLLQATYEKKQKNANNENKKHEISLLDDLKKFSEKVAEGSDENVKDFRPLIAVFGGSCAVDLLYKFRPEFKDLPIERIKSCLAEYLGDFLLSKQEFRIKDVGAAVEFLSDTTLREGLYETMKEHCLQYYFEQRRQGAAGNSYEIIYNYLVHITNELHGVSNKFLDDVIEDVVSYFNSAIQEFKKPDKFVDRLTEDREFPDLNQRINMKELADKKRMLIADEMGLGKSASVIMAKEHLQLGCALVIVPKITERTWQDYLSDDAVRKGYFKQGQAPRVLVVTSVADLDGVTKKDFDYIIISQAKLNGRYATLLEELDPDMLIVDESHKFKNGKGVRTNVLLPLARKLEGSGKYLAMLTGTPIPNKVNDIAVALKLLYPDKFGDTPVGELATTIIRGDVIDLRSLLVPHMQMKELEDVVVMPKREQVSEGVTLSSTERDVYEALLELDEITAFEKMKALRTFLLNPELVGVEPGIRSSKFEALQNKLSETFKSKSKVLVVVNDYVSGIMRGKEFLFQQLCLPKDVSVEFIHGDDGSQSNENIRPDLQRRFNEGSEKMLLIVSGAAADVGISLVGAEETIIYNEPWTESDLKQQKARVFRQGLDHDITETTFIVKNSIEEGLHDYIAKKQKAIEKILKGIPISELEMRMVENAEKNKDGDVSEEDYEVNPELARHYFSVKHRLLLMFAHIKQRGEEEIRKFFETWGAEYAQGYREVGARSVQANANRVAGALMSEMITASGRHPAALQILDVASGPEMLRRHCADMLQPSITSLDINKHHFENGTLGKTFVGGWTAMPFKDRAFDYLNCAMAFQDSEFVPSKNKYERLDVLREMNRVLQPGGRVVINMIYSMEMNDMEKFRLFVEAIGFKIVTDFTGIAEFEDQYYSQVITLEKIADSEKKSEEVVAEIGIEHRVGLKMHKTKKTLRNDRKILKYGFYLNGKSKPILLNSADQKVSHEENMIEDEIAKLKKVYKTIREIPVQEIIDRGYVRISLSKKYYLFKRLITAPGIILIK